MLNSLLITTSGYLGCEGMKNPLPIALDGYICKPDVIPYSLTGLTSRVEDDEDLLIIKLFLNVID